MIGSPHRKHRAGKLGHVTQKKPAAIVWSQRCHTLIGAYRPGMCEVLAQRERAYRRDRPPAALTGATLIVVDDGLATGASMRAALQGLRAFDPAAVVVAVPVGSPGTCRELRAEADEVVCVRMPDRFLAVGQAYDDFSPTTDDQVRAVLEALSPVSVKSPHRP